MLGIYSDNFDLKFKNSFYWHCIVLYNIFLYILYDDDEISTF